MLTVSVRGRKVHPPRIDSLVTTWQISPMRIFAGCIVLMMISCVRVKPYQRATHASQAMQDPAEEETRLDNHVHEYREGAIGGSGKGGGGCGCN